MPTGKEQMRTDCSLTLEDLDLTRQICEWGGTRLQTAWRAVDKEYRQGSGQDLLAACKAMLAALPAE